MVDLSIVVPTLNERDNVRVLVQRLDAALQGLHWEAVFVDDDSTDGTTGVLRAMARTDPRVRLIHRVGRRGLSSACIEGIQSTAAPFIAVMDADLQHDESILPAMLDQIRSSDLDLVVASRYVQGGGVGGFSRGRRLLSRLGAAISRRLLNADLNDPMSGFFLLRRDFFDTVVHGLTGIGFKILLDIVATSPRPVRLVEVPFSFGTRSYGESKLDVNVSVEYLILILDKLMHGLVPVRFLLFAIVGLSGIVVHQSVLALLHLGVGLAFMKSQIAAAGVAMITNFIVNNRLTYRDRRLRGRRFFFGMVWFVVCCSFGALANLALARASFQVHIPWFVAGLFGTIMAAVWNFSVGATLTWRPSRGPGERRQALAESRLVRLIEP